MQGRGGSDAVAGKGAKDGRRAKGGRHTAREEQAANQPRLEQEAEVLLRIPNWRLNTSQHASSLRTRALAQIAAE
jgi:hypothetical protein